MSRAYWMDIEPRLCRWPRLTDRAGGELASEVRTVAFVVTSYQCACRIGIGVRQTRSSADERLPVERRYMCN